MDKVTIGQRCADFVAQLVGSWMFIIFQSLFMACWIAANVTGLTDFDPYPFVLLNLFLSFQAAYTAPFIMMSQGRQATKDRMTIEADLVADLKSVDDLAMLRNQVMELHTKMDAVLAALPKAP